MTEKASAPSVERKTRIRRLENRVVVRPADLCLGLNVMDCVVSLGMTERHRLQHAERGPYLTVSSGREFPKNLT